MKFNVIKTTVAVFPGRFQPFSKHHAAAFKFLQQKFGPTDTFIATSDFVKPPKSPLNFQEKKEIIDQYGFGDKLIQVKNPYKAEEITSKYDPETTAIVFMVGDKDMKEDPRFTMKTKKDGTEGYFKPYKGNENKLKGYNKHGYLVVAPHQSYSIPRVGEMSGTNVRIALSSDVSSEKYKEIFRSIFGWYNEEIAKMLKQKFSFQYLKETRILSFLFKALLLEGGNVFKNEQGKEATQRINREDVIPTIKYLEKITGLNLLDGMLGTTGKKDTSGDLDLAVSEKEISKEELVSLLLKNFPKGDIKKSGTNVHLKTPIKGNSRNGFVQTDFMFGDRDWMKFSMRGGAENSNFKGVDRHILLSSIAKAQGLKWSYLNGLVNRETNKTITKNPDEIAKMILGDNASSEDLSSVESILNIIKHRKDYKHLISQAESDFEKKGLTLNEGLLKESSARIQHPEDLTYWEGAKGALRALTTMLSIIKDPGKISVKWDGSPAMIFGVGDDGKFILTDKSGFVAKGYNGKATSGEELKNMFLNRGKNSGKPITKDYANFANNMGSMFEVFKNTFPSGLKGFFKGDLLYQSTPKVQNGNFIFKPNITTYSIPVKSEMGKQITSSEVGIVLHRYISTDGVETPIKNISDYKFKPNKGLFIVPPVLAKNPPKINKATLSKAKGDISAYGEDIDSLLNKSNLTSMKISNFPDLLYKFTNSKVSNLNSLSSKEFISFIEKEPSLTSIKRDKIIEYCNLNSKALDELFEVVKDIISVKDNLIDQLDSQDLGVKASIGDLVGGEGYVVADPKGDIKLVNRAGFTAANRAIQR